MKKRVKSIIKIFSIFIFTILCSHLYISYTLPSSYNIFEDENRSFKIFPFFVSTKPTTSCVKAADNSFSSQKSYIASLNFLNLIPIKTVKVNIVPRRNVNPCGTPFGVKIYTEGVMVINISDVQTEYGNESPGKSCGLQKGDIITKIDGKKIKNNEELEKIIENSSGNKINISIVRNNKEIQAVLKPKKSCEDGKYRAGIWVRDSCAGIGTLTFKDKENNMFGGLGHGICDTDTGGILPLAQGDIVEAVISDVKKGRKGLPGELKGCFVNTNSLGKIFENNEMGVYGVLNENDYNQESIEIALKQHVKKGPAHILTTTEGNQPEMYEINIDSINYNVNAPTKNIKISITDQKLIEKTGGIVQGMSGSPIIQNNMLVGAVTHVFVNDPSKGYAIFAETMLTNSNKVFEREHKKAS